MHNTEIRADQVTENAPSSAELPDGSGVVLARIDGELIAFSAKCPHAAGDFREGEIHRGRAFCPVHQWKFDIKTGRCVGDENYRLKKFVIQVINGFVWLEVDSG